MTTQYQIEREYEVAGRAMRRAMRGRDQIARRVYRAAMAAGLLEVTGRAVDLYHLRDDDDRLLEVAGAVDRVGLVTDAMLVLIHHRRRAAAVVRAAGDIAHRAESVDVYRRMVRVIRRAIRADRYERRRAALSPGPVVYSDEYGRAALRRRAGLTD